MRLLLIQPPHIGEKTYRAPNFLPLGLGYIASFLRENGYDPSLLDIWGLCLTKSQVVDFLKSNTFDVYGIGALSTQWSYVDWLTSQIRAIANKPIILGGPLATFGYREVLENLDVGICALSEGEVSFLELIKALDNGTSYENIPGIAHKSEDQIHVTKPVEYVRELDTVPFPAYDLFKVNSYISNCRPYNRYSSFQRDSFINIITGRGCPYNCKFCSKTFSGVRLRSIDNVIEEIKYLKQRYYIDGVFFNDELVLTSKDRAHELCQKIGPLNLKWCCQGRTNIVDKELLTEMKKSGCVSVGYGAESGSRRILKNMKKAQTPEQIVEAVNTTVEVGIEPVFQWMFGYPGEDDASMADTYKTFSKVKWPITKSFLCTPLPGTELFTEAVTNGKIGDIVDYYKNLSDGYNAKRGDLVNFTNWPDEELLLKKKLLEKKLIRNYFLSSLVRPVKYRYLFMDIQKVISSFTKKLRKRVGFRSV